MLDAIWRKYATLAGVFEARPQFHSPAARSRVKAYATLKDQSPAMGAVLEDLVIDPDLVAALRAGIPGAQHLAYELICLGAPVDAMVSHFSRQHYLTLYPDIASANMNALDHYLRFGASEGRKTLAEIRRNQMAGTQPFRPEWPTVLICVHEMSRTGAPVVGRDLMREAARDHNVIVAALRGGDLLDSFLEGACMVVISPNPMEDFKFTQHEAFSQIEFAILNSVECVPFIRPLVAREIPFASYIHEYADYTFPVWKSTFTGLFSDIVVFSSEHVRDSWQGRLTDIDFDMARDTSIIAQRPAMFGTVPDQERDAARAHLSGLLGRDLTGTRIICGAGHLQWRKGSDIFLMVSRMARRRSDDTVFLWIGAGQNFEDMGFGTWFDYHLRQIGANDPQGNLFLLPAGDEYQAVMQASDAMFVSSRLDPLPNVVFDALAQGCRVVYFEGGTGFSDAAYQGTDRLIGVDYADPEAALLALLALPPKTGQDAVPAPAPADFNVFLQLRTALRERLAQQDHFVIGASTFDLPILFGTSDEDRPLRQRAREKIQTYGRRMLWRDIAEVERSLRQSDNWVHRGMRVATHADIPPQEMQADLPAFSLHVHAFYTDELAEDLRNHQTYHLARRIVVTTDTEEKRREIAALMAAEGLTPEIVLVPNRGRDILPFLDLFAPGGVAGQDEIWCHVHQKKSLASATGGDVWRKFLLRVLLGDATSLPSALREIADPRVGLVAPLDPHYVGWSAARKMLPRFAKAMPGPLPAHPLLFPIGNMFWVRRPVIDAMRALFGPAYLWPNEPIPNDGTEFHLIERLWPAMAAQCGLDAVFVHKTDERRV